MTPRVFTNIMQGRANARLTAANDARRMAWLTANLSRAKRLPRVEAVLVDMRGNLQMQSPEDMITALRSFQAAGAEMEFKFVPHEEGDS